MSHNDQDQEPQSGTTLGDALAQLALPFFVVAISIFIAIAAWILFLRPTTFQPLEYSLQRVEGVNPRGELFVPSINGQAPAVFSNGIVPVATDVVNTHDKDVGVEGTIEWQQIDPNGFTCRVVTDRPGLLPPGESLRRFENTIPTCVRDHVILQDSPSRWVICLK